MIMRNPLQRDHLLSLAGAPIIWTVHFLLCYAIVSIACSHGFAHGRLFGLNMVDLGIGVTNVAALALLAWSGLGNYRKWRCLRAAGAGKGDISRFFAINAMLLSGLSIITLSWVAFPTLMLPPCAA